MQGELGFGVREVLLPDLLLQGWLPAHSTCPPQGRGVWSSPGWSCGSLCCVLCNVLSTSVFCRSPEDHVQLTRPALAAVLLCSMEVTAKGRSWKPGT